MVKVEFVGYENMIVGIGKSRFQVLETKPYSLPAVSHIPKFGDATKSPAGDAVSHERDLLASPT